MTTETTASAPPHKPLIGTPTDEATVDSLLSDWNESESEEDEDDDAQSDDDESEDKSYDDQEEEELDESCCVDTTYLRLQRKFALRNSLLNRMCKGKDPSYAAMLMHHESLVQAEAFRVLQGESDEVEMKQHESEEGSSTKPSPQAFARPLSSLETLRNRFLFETHLTIPGLLAVLLYCSAHLAAYEVTQCIVLELTRIVQSELLFYTGCIAVSLLTIRLTGGVFEWVSNERHETAKFDLHNRIRLGDRDAKVHLWFRQHATMKFVLNTIAVYICLVGVSYLHYRLLSPFFANRDWLIDNLPSKAKGMDTPIHWWLKGRFVPECNNEATTDGGADGNASINEECSWFEELTNEDERYVWNNVAVASYHQFMGNELAPGLTPWTLQVLHGSIAAVAIYMLHKLGLKSH
jgi:hypothetical protein